MSVLTPILKKFGSPTPNRFQKVHFEANYDAITKSITSLFNTRDDKACKRVMEMLVGPLTKDAELEFILLQLRDNIMHFDRENEIIVSFLLRVSWANREPNAVAAYQNLILNLVSAHTGYINSVLQMLIGHFLPKRDNTSSDETPTDKEKCLFENVHNILCEILKLVPSSPTLLLKFLQGRSPYMQKDAYLHVAFIHNLLAVGDYATDIRQQILELIVVKLLQVDVHCPVQDVIDAENTFDDEENDEELFDMETDDDIMKPQDQLKHKPMKHNLGNMLDCCLNVIFKYIRDVCYKNDELDWAETKKLYKELLAIFDKLILPTFASSHVQYIMFYIISFRPPLYEGFLDYLWKKVQNPNSACILRQTAVTYISGLLSRAKYIPKRTVVTCFDIMCPWIHYYIDSQEDSIKVEVNAVIHGTFYAVCQAIFYIFAFRQKELTETQQGLQYLLSLNLERMVTCRLNPLKICDSVVVKNFASISRKFQLAYCHTIMEKNSRNQLPIAVEDTSFKSLYLGSKLNTFFPFDPYILTRSGSYISEIYRVYEGELEVEKTETNNDEDDFLLNESALISPIATPKEAHSFEDFFSYKMSPGFRHIIPPT